MDEEFQVTLTSEKYDDFLRCISILKDVCTDIDIRDGKIRQRSNDRYCVFDIDLTPIINDLSFPISNFKQKLDLLKIFSGHEVVISLNNTAVSFSDQNTKIDFQNVDPEYMDNKFMSIEEKEQVFNIDESNLILSTEISESLSDRMKIITSGFSVNSIQIKIEGESASIQTKTQAGDQNAVIIDGIVTDKIMDASSNIINTPFIIDHDGNIEFKMFLNEDDQISSNQFSTTISDIDIIIYVRSTLVT